MTKLAVLPYMMMTFVSIAVEANERLAPLSHAESCQDGFKPQIERAHAERLIQKIQGPHKPGQHGVRLIVWNGTETPDPDHPVPVDFPEGRKWVMGLSGQSVIVVDRLSELDGRKQLNPVKIRLLNKNGYGFGEEIENGQPLDYSVNSSTWDAFVVAIRNRDGESRLKIFAGTMGDDASGRPLLQRDPLARSTRQRMVFDARISVQDGLSQLIGFNPRTIFGYETPTGKNWILKNKQGETRFAHGYGGGPMVLANGELYLDPYGRAVMYHEEVVEERDGWPYRTAIIRTYLDPTSLTAVGERKIVLDVFKPARDSKGQRVAYSATRRLGGGYLIEGSHVQALIAGFPARNMQQIERARKANVPIQLRMAASPGDYFSLYGSALAYSETESGPFRYVENEEGELYDFLKDLRPLFTWMGRPVLYVDEFGQEMVAFHGVPRTSLADDVPLDILPPDAETFARFKRGILTSPIERIHVNGTEAIRLKDNTGLLESLRNFAPRSALLDYKP